MNSFSNCRYQGIRRKNSNESIEAIEFNRCTFDSCTIGGFDPSSRVRVSNCVIRDCSQEWCQLYGTIFEELVIDGLKSNGLLMAWACAFRHVVLRGRIGSLMLSPKISPLPSDRGLRQQFDSDNASFYKATDWALDISEIDCDEIDIRSIPVDLIRTNPQTQAILRREEILANKHKWMAIDFSGTDFRTAINFVIDLGLSGTVLVATPRSKSFEREQQVLQELREIGVAK